MTHLKLKLLGSYRLILDGQPIDALESGKERALLAYLAVESNCPHSREKLIGIFWPGQNEEHARGSLSQALYHLRGVLGDRPLTGILPADADTRHREPFLWVTPREIQLNPHSECETDAAIFSALVKACKAHADSPYQGCEDCLHRYQQADKLYAGDFLDDLYLPKSMAFEEWATVLREQLRLQEMGVLEYLVGAFERKGELGRALVYGHKMVHLDELGEPGIQYVMRLLASLGRRDEALAQYTLFSQALTVQLGSEPGMETKSLYQRLRSEAAGAEKVSLPARLLPFVGRKQELDDLWGMLRDPMNRLICVLGPGGSGKTRLALEAASRQRYFFKDGVFLVSLSTLGTGSPLLPAIADGLGFIFRDFAEPKKQLLDYLHHKQVLFVFDSFETVVESAGLVIELLAASLTSKALVTSRVRLNLSGEQVYPLKGMQMPPEGAGDEAMEYSAVELFLQAARRAMPQYQPDSLAYVAHICRLLDGMPLSLMLASNWVSDFSAQEIASQISNSLDFLAVEWADLPARQQSLRATFEYSWNLLEVREQETLMSLAVFRNPFTSQAAYQVSGTNYQMLHALVGKSFLERSSEGFYHMHDLVRQYCGDKLAHNSNEWECTTLQRHSEYFIQQLVGWGTQLKGPNQVASLAEGDRMIDDVLSAWESAVKHTEQERLLQALEGLCLYYSLRYRFEEGERACRLAIGYLQNGQAEGEQPNLEGWLLAWQASFCRLMGKVSVARFLLDAAQEKLNHAREAGQDTRRGQALLWRERDYYSTSLHEKLDYLQNSASLYQELGDAWSQAGVIIWAGEYANRLGDYELALNLHQHAETLSRSAGNQRRLGEALRLLGTDYMVLGPWETGARLIAEAVSCYCSIGDLGSRVFSDVMKGLSFAWTGNFNEGCEQFELALVKLHDLGDRYYLSFSTLAYGICLVQCGKYVQAVEMLQESLLESRQDGFQREEAFSLAQIGCVALAQGEPDRALENCQASVDIFRLMGFAGELGMALAAQTLAQHCLGQEGQAWVSLTEALRLAIQTHSRFTLITLASALAVLLADANRCELSVVAYCAMTRDPLVSNSRWFADMVGDRMKLARQHLPTEIVQAVEARGREGDLFDVLGTLAKEISTGFKVPTRQT